MSVPTNERKPADEGTTAPPPRPRSKKPYTKPELEPLGDIRDVTLAGSLGAGESGMGGMTRKP